MTGPGQIVIRRSVWSTSFALIPGLVFLGLGLYVAIKPFAAGSGLNEGLICITIGIVCLFFCLREMADRRPYIVMDDQGLRALQLSMQNNGQGPKATNQEFYGRQMEVFHLDLFAEYGDETAKKWLSELQRKTNGEYSEWDRVTKYLGVQKAG